VKKVGRGDNDCAKKKKKKKEKQFKLEFKLISTEEEEKSNYANVTFETNNPKMFTNLRHKRDVDVFLRQQ
jgi:hypothetical protein